MWLLSTCNRPEIIGRLIASMREVGCVPDVAVMINGAGVLYDHVDWPEHWRIHHAPENLELVGGINALYALHPGKQFYGLLIDHCLALSPDWATRLENAAGDWNIANCEGDVRISQHTGFPKLTIAAALGGELCRALGYVLPDFSVHFWGDDALEEIGWELGIAKIVPGTEMKNLLVTKGEIPRDENHKRLFQGKSFVAEDARAFREWKKAIKPALMKRLTTLIPAAARVKPRVSKEKHSITICSVNAGNYCGRGAEYVNILCDMIARNLPAGFIGRFICFTDDAAGLDPWIEARPLPVPGLEGWWNKLALFKDGVFADGERVWFFDLDTLILGPLGDIFAYDGEFATLKDFYHPSRVGPAVMSWQVGPLSKSIWAEWDACGRSTNGHGDLWWINNLDQGRFAKVCDKLQDRFPDSLVSFKVHCQPCPPRGARVVCFHGEPRPHETETAWVKGVWRKGGAVDVLGGAVPLSELERNIRHACTLDVPWLGEAPPHAQEAVLVGGGPSLRVDLGQIRLRQQNGQQVFALNGAARFLQEQGIAPDYQIVMSARGEDASFIIGGPTVAILASQAHPQTWEAAREGKALLFHAAMPGILEFLPPVRRATILAGGGRTVLTRAMAIVHFMGFRTQHLYGVDSSFEGAVHHAYEQASTDSPIPAQAGDREFSSCPWMVAQVEEFQEAAFALIEESSTIAVHGSGLLPYVAQLMLK